MLFKYLLKQLLDSENVYSDHVTTHLMITLRYASETNIRTLKKIYVLLFLHQITEKKIVNN